MALERIPYRINSDDFIRVSIYMDKRSGQMMSSRCPLMQGTDPCMGDAGRPCHGRFDLCNSPDKIVCMDEIGRLGELPDWVQTEWVDFSKVTWEIKEFLDFDTIQPHPTDPQMVIRNFRKERELKIKYLLKDWSLSRLVDHDKRFEIKRRQARGFSPGTMELEPSTLEFIKTSIDPGFVDKMIREYEIKSVEPINYIEQNAIAQVEDAISPTKIDLKN